MSFVSEHVVAKEDTLVAKSETAEQSATPAEIAAVTPTTPSKNFQSFEMRTAYGRTMFHIDGDATSVDIDNMIAMMSYTVDALRECGQDGEYVYEGSAPTATQSSSTATGGLKCGLCGSTSVSDERQSKRTPKAPDMRCKSCDAVVWPNKPGEWVPGKPNPNR